MFYVLLLLLHVTHALKFEEYKVFSRAFSIDTLDVDVVASDGAHVAVLDIERAHVTHVRSNTTRTREAPYVCVCTHGTAVASPYDVQVQGAQWVARVRPAAARVRCNSVTHASLYENNTLVYAGAHFADVHTFDMSEDGLIVNYLNGTTWFYSLRDLHVRHPAHTHARALHAYKDLVALWEGKNLDIVDMRTRALIGIIRASEPIVSASLYGDQVCTLDARGTVRLYNYGFTSEAVLIHQVAGAHEVSLGRDSIAISTHAGTLHVLNMRAVDAVQGTIFILAFVACMFLGACVFCAHTPPVRIFY